MEDCSTCKYATPLDFFIWCDNDNSDYNAKPVRSDNFCEYWEEKENGN